MTSASTPATAPPARWAILLAFSLVYLCWGTTYLAIRVGVQAFPWALFGGTRIALAGAIILLFLAVRREPLRLSFTEFLWSCLTGFFLFVLGNGLITAGERQVESGVASVLTATTPLWAALLELCWPRGDRLSLRGWLGLFLGLGGVYLLLEHQLGGLASFLQNTGPLLVLASSMAWAMGAVILRHRRKHNTHLSASAYQMLCGGVTLMLIGIAMGQTEELSWDHVTPGAIYAFFHLLIFGSLMGYVSYVWLLRHVSVNTATTYAYVNPLVAILVGWLIGHEALTVAMLGGMACVLAGVALVRGGERAAASLEIEPPPRRGYSTEAQRLKCQQDSKASAEIEKRCALQPQQPAGTQPSESTSS